MNIAFDATVILEPIKGKKELRNHGFDFIEEIMKIDDKNKYYAFNLEEKGTIKNHFDCLNVEEIFFYTGKFNEIILKNEFRSIFGEIIKNFIKRNQIDIFIITSPCNIDAAYYEKEWFQGTKTIIIWPDISPYVIDKKFQKDSSKYGVFLKHMAMICWADRCIFRDQGIKNDMMEYFHIIEEHIYLLDCNSDERFVLSKMEEMVQEELLDLEISQVKKVAMFTPLPPMRSGISDYSVDIISQLTKEFEIDVYIDRYKPNIRDMRNVHIYYADDFERNHKKYDRIIYQVGNSLYHEYMFPFIKEYPGIVVLHDYNLREVLEAMYLHRKKEPGKFMDNILEDYKPELADRYFKLQNTPYTLYYEINGFVTKYAEKIIVHSEYARKKLLEKDISRRSSMIPLYAVIDKISEKEESRDNLRIEKKSIIFAAFGFIHRSKRILPTLEAFGRICMEQDELNAKFYFVGGMVTDLEEEFHEKVKKYQLEDKVFVTGYIPLDEFDKYLDISDICVNFRYPYNGESSASLTRILAKGKCVIVNNIGSFSEIPEEACIRIDNVAQMDTAEEIRQIYEAMKQALDNTLRKKIQYEAQKYAKEHLSLEKIGKLYIQAIRERGEKKCALSEEKLKLFANKYMNDYSEEEMKKMACTFAYSMPLEG